MAKRLRRPVTNAVSRKSKNVDLDTKNQKVAKKDDTIDKNSTKDAIYNESVNTDGTDRDTKDETILDGTTNDAVDSKNVIKISIDHVSSPKDDTGVNNIIQDA
ncbi:unnamed protein product [Allacma fusca]|uniref:Uncharacterized protein n=1 Tax=Allacma fusca TaxID=39272 RepID=A0A8J2PFD2_9HEXA|nr:unnamed protein product [Allacma fusca]